MEDENLIELSLGLSCGGSSSKSKLKDGSSDPKAAEGSGNTSMVGDLNVSGDSFQPFFPTSIEKLDHNGQQRSVPVIQQRENFWTDLGQRSEADGPSYRELWVSNNKPDAEEEKSGLNKRKLPFEEINLEKKHERGFDHGVVRGKSPNAVILKSHFSVTTEDGSYGENEYVAESEAEASTSWLVPRHEENANGSDAPKVNDRHFLTESSAIGSQDKKQSKVTGNDSNLESGKLASGIPFSLQPLPVMTVPYPVPVNVPAIANAPNASGFPSHCVMHLMPLGNSEHPTVQPMNSSNMQLAFGYPSVQLPTLETDSSWLLGPRIPQLTAHTSRGPSDGLPITEQSEDDLKISHAVVQAPHNPSAGLMYGGKASDLMRGSSGKHDEEAGASFSSRTEDDTKGNRSTFRIKEIPNPPVVEDVPHEGSTIRPGIASSLKFGGCGSHPDLPWVSTTGPGPNGKTISGVTYKYSRSQIKIVCACHGSHMSPEEFVQHASVDAVNEVNSTGLASFPSNNTAASAQS